MVQAGERGESDFRKTCDFKITLDTLYRMIETRRKEMNN